MDQKFIKVLGPTILRVGRGSSGHTSAGNSAKYFSGTNLVF